MKRHEHLLFIVAEECAEIGQRASKQNEPPDWVGYKLSRDAVIAACIAYSHSDRNSVDGEEHAMRRAIVAADNGLLKVHTDAVRDFLREL